VLLLEFKLRLIQASFLDSSSTKSEEHTTSRWFPLIRILRLQRVV